MVNILLVLWWLIASLSTCGGCLLILKDWERYHMKKMTTKSFVTGLIIDMLIIIVSVGSIIVSFVLMYLDIIPVKPSHFI